jgi:signal transduction histidine kinase/CheY-like chemotaxis protein/AraC-like DNA-binding protein
LTAEKKKTIWWHALCLLRYSVVPALLCCLCDLQAQTTGGLSVQDLERDMVRAEALLRSFKNDSAGILATKTIAALKQRNMLDSPLGLKAQLLEGSALERDEQNELAVQKLQHVWERSRDKKQWDVLAQAGLSIALLYEKLGRRDQSREYLQQTQSAIDDHGLDSIYPSYAIRIASWHRIFGDRDSSMYYVQEALRTAPMFGKNLEEANGHMLAGILLRDSLPELMLKHSFDGLRLYYKIEDYVGCGYMYTGIAEYYYRDKKDYPRALMYNDSMIAMANKAIEAGHEKHTTISLTYQFRGAILKQLGQIDSAWFYLKKGYEMELKDFQENTAAKVIEIDARYTDDKKTEQIEDQTLALRLRNTQLRYSIITTILILFLAGGLLFGFYKQRQAKRKLSEQNKLIQAQSEKLKSLDAAKSRFFANVSHELRTPLTLMLGPVKTLLQGNQLTEKQTRLLQTVNQSGQQLQQLVNEILDLQKLEMGKMELHEKPTGLAGFFGRYAAQFESLAHRKQIDYSFETTVGDEVVANIDQEKCRQIIYNLLSNAFKFTPESGRIKVSFSFHKDTLQLEVADTGSGIHPDDLPHVFDRFFQTNRPDKPSVGGTGIGLALCHEYAHLFGGKIEVESTLGKGSIFQVAFPLKMDESRQSAVGAKRNPDEERNRDSSRETGDVRIAPAVELAKEHIPPTTSSESKPTILVVEDNPELQDYIRLILEEKYSVLTAGNGQAALNRLLPTAHPAQGAATAHHASVVASCQLILSDLMMPVMDGYQLLEKLKNDDATRHIPVIMLTARAEAGDKLKALRIGVDDYLTKPFDEEELLARIENLLKNRAVRELVQREEQPGTASPILAQAEADWLADFEAYIRAHIADDALSISFLAQEFSMSESTFLRQVTRITGLSPKQYLQEVRLHAARELLESKTYSSVSQVSEKVGYSNVRTFTRSFRERFGKLPSEV